jgi:23S rRNA pseudouridine1911/1915/1917 synthase
MNYREPPADAPVGMSEDEDDATPEVRHTQVTVPDHGQRLDKFLAQWVTEFSRSHLQGLIEAGHVQVDGAPQRTASRRLAVHQRISVELVPTAQSLAFRPQTLPLDIVFEDEDILVLNKGVGLVVHPAAGHWSGTLLNGLLAHHAGAASLPRAGIVHRLDKDTSGLMVVGKTLVSVTALSRAIAAREVRRQYLAIAHGSMPAARLEIEAPIGRDPQSRVRMTVLASGKPARTDVDRLVAADGFSGVRCTLHSGRTHQIRVHLASRGMPLVGDALYGGKPALGLVRQALHATWLAFAHPRSGAPLAWRAPPPCDFEQAWRQLDPLGQAWD